MENLKRQVEAIYVWQANGYQIVREERAVYASKGEQVVKLFNKEEEQP